MRAAAPVLYIVGVIQSLPGNALQPRIGAAKQVKAGNHQITGFNSIKKQVKADNKSIIGFNFAKK